MTDNTIDITDRLKPWRQKLPERYAERIDELLAMQKDVLAMYNRLAEIKNNVHPADADTNTFFLTLAVADSISEAMVLLGCAGDKLVHTVPTEEIELARSRR